MARKKCAIRHKKNPEKLKICTQSPGPGKMPRSGIIFPENNFFAAGPQFQAFFKLSDIIDMFVFKT